MALFDDVSLCEMTKRALGDREILPHASSKESFQKNVRGAVVGAISQLSSNKAPLNS